MREKNDPYRNLARQLPALIETALRRYQDFTRAAPPVGDAKVFGAHATASKAALGHLEQLLKLARMVDGDTPANAEPPPDTGRLIADAEAALEKTTKDT